MCQNNGGDLVIVTSMEEMVRCVYMCVYACEMTFELLFYLVQMFLNKLGNHVKFWIGLSKTSDGNLWKWTNGQWLGSS